VGRLAGVVGTVVLGVGRSPAGAPLGWVGLILGALNARMAQVSVARYSDHGEFSKGSLRSACSAGSV